MKSKEKTTAKCTKFQRKGVQNNQSTSSECTHITKIEDLCKNKSKLKPKLFTPQHRIINSKRAHQAKRSGCRSESEIYYSRRD